MKVLFLSSKNPGDAEHTFYTGLFRLFGNQAVDFPCLKRLWQKRSDSPVVSYEGWLENEQINVDRENIQEKLTQNYFDLIIVDINAWEEYSEQLKRKENVCLLDGNPNRIIDFTKMKGLGIALYLKNECPPDQTGSRVRTFPLSFEPIPLSHLSQDGSILISNGGQALTGFFPDLSSRFVFGFENNPSLLSSASVAIVQKEGERTPLAFWQVLAAGIPLFAKRPLDEIPYLPVEGVEAVYFDGFEDLRVKLEYFFANPEKLIELGRRGREAFERNHSCKARVKDLIVEYAKTLKRSLMISNLYHSEEIEPAIFEPGFLKELVLTDVAEFCGIFNEAEDFWKNPVLENNQSMVDVCDWKSILRGHRFLLEGDLITAVQYYEKTSYFSLGTKIIHGIVWFLLGNRVRATSYWMSVYRDYKLAIMKTLVNTHQTPDAHKERLVLLPLLRGKGLEIGCGARKTSDDIIGIDLLGKGDVGEYGVVKDFKSVADYKCSGDNLYFFDNESMDYVIQRHNLEHYSDPVKALKEWSRVLKPGGLLGFVVPDDEQLDTITLDDTHKHVFTIDSMKVLVALFPELEIVHIDVCMDKWSFLAVIQKKGGTPFDYQAELQKCEIAETIRFFQMKNIPHKPEHILQGLMYCLELSQEKEKTVCGIIDTLLLRNEESMALELLEKRCREFAEYKLLKTYYYLSLGKEELASRIFASLTGDEKQGYLYYYLACLLMLQQGKKEEAWRYLASSLQENPEQKEAVEQFVTFSRELEKEVEAIEILKTFGNTSLPVRSTVLYQMSLLQSESGMKDDAVITLRDLLSQKPDYPEGLRLLQELCLGE